MWLNGSDWLIRRGDKSQKPWCQWTKLGTEQVTSNVATGTELDQIFDWTLYSTFNRIRNFIAYCMKFKTNQNRPLKADEIHQAKQILCRFVQK